MRLSCTCEAIFSSSWVRWLASEVLHQLQVFDAEHGLAGEGLQNAEVFAVEGVGLRLEQVQHAVVEVQAAQRQLQQRAVALRRPAKPGRRFEVVGNVLAFGQLVRRRPAAQLVGLRGLQVVVQGGVGGVGAGVGGVEVEPGGIGLHGLHRRLQQNAVDLGRGLAPLNNLGEALQALDFGPPLRRRPGSRRQRHGRGRGNIPKPARPACPARRPATASWSTAQARCFAARAHQAGNGQPTAQQRE